MVFSTMSVVSSINQPSTQPINQHENNMKKVDLISMATTTLKERGIADDVKLKLPTIKVRTDSLKHVERANTADEHKLQVKPIQKVEVKDKKETQDGYESKAISATTTTTLTSTKLISKTLSQKMNNTELKENIKNR